MADVFTQVVIRSISTDVAFNAAIKAYLDTLVATKIDTISYIPTGSTIACIVVSHA